MERALTFVKNRNLNWVQIVFGPEQPFPSGSAGSDSVDDQKRDSTLAFPMWRASPDSPGIYVETTIDSPFLLTHTQKYSLRPANVILVIGKPSQRIYHESRHRSLFGHCHSTGMKTL